MAKSMNGQLSMFHPEISGDSSSAISSPASEAGATPCGSPDGPMIDTFGPGAVPVSRSRAQERAMAQPIRATFGRRGFGSSESAGLSKSLVSKLRARLDLDGSILFRLIWKQRITPSGRLISALRASARSTSGSDYGSWPTTTKEDARSSARHGYMVTGNQGTTLLDAARLASWQTPRGEISGDTPETHEARQARVVAKHGRRMGTPLEVRAGWAIPLATDCEAAGCQNNPSLTNQVTGRYTSGYRVETGSGGQLNPAHSRWLMGYPPEWDACAVTAMPSTRGLRKK
jgi:hypothetical protein